MNTPELTARLGLKTRVALIKPNGRNVPGNASTGAYTLLDGGRATRLTGHDTANPKENADAEMHRIYVRDGGGPDKVSFTYVVDDTELVQLLPDNAMNNAQGSKEGNRTSASIELCVNRDADQDKARDNYAKAIAAFLVANGLQIDDLVQHNFWLRADGTHKNCPASIRRIPGGWEVLLERVKFYIGVLDATLVAPTAEILHIDIAAHRLKPIDVYGPPGISADHLALILTKLGSPAAKFVDDIWRVEVQNYRRPEVLQRIFERESHSATDPGTAEVIHHLNNPGHIRPPETWTPPGVLGVVDTKWGPFLRFDTIVHGFEALALLFGIPLYTKQTNLRERIRLFAPKRNGNDPDGYTDFLEEGAREYLAASASFDYVKP